MSENVATANAVEATLWASLVDCVEKIALFAIGGPLIVFCLVLLVLPIMGWGVALYRVFKPGTVKIVETWAGNDQAPQKTLIILAHGLGPPGFASMGGIAASLEEAEVDVWRLQYDLNLWSNQSYFHLSKLVAEAISLKLQSAKGHRYERIILAGHSAGALIMRSAFLYCICEEYKSVCDQKARLVKSPKANADLSPVSFDWTGKVDRVVLLAGLNAGWNRNFARFLNVPYVSPFPALGRLLRLGSVSYELEQGSPFIEALRFGQLQNHGLGVPVIQIIGTKDGVVDAKTEMDLPLMGEHTYFLLLDHVNHRNIIKVIPDTEASPEDMKRMQAVHFALLGDFSRNDEKTVPLTRSAESTAYSRQLNHAAPDWIKDTLVSPSAQMVEDSRITRAIVILHGIRDDGHWADRFRLFIQEALDRDAEEGGKDKGDLVIVLSPSFGRFSITNLMIPFLNRRNYPVRWFAKTCVDIQMKYRNVEKIDFLGHSFGTYVFGEFVRNYPMAVKFGNAYLAGSVLPRSFGWDQYLEQNSPAWSSVRTIANATASNDYVVSLGPGGYQQLARFFGKINDFFRERIFNRAQNTRAAGTMKAVRSVRILRNTRSAMADFFELGTAGTDGFEDELSSQVIGVNRLIGDHGAFSASPRAIMLASEFVSNGNSDRFSDIKTKIEADYREKYDGETGLFAKRTKTIRKSPLAALALIVLALSGLMWFLLSALQNQLLPGVYTLPIPLLVVCLVYLFLDRF